MVRESSTGPVRSARAVFDWGLATSPFPSSSRKAPIRCRRAINAAVQSGSARLAGMSHAELTATMQPYLPILRAFVLLQRPTSPAQRERLVQRVDATLRSENWQQAF
jgi:hypothetical protein